MSGRRLKAERRKAFGRVGEPQTSEQAENLRNDYAVRATDARDRMLAATATAMLHRVGSADFAFTEPPEGMPTVELGSFFGIDPSSYDLWSANTFDFSGPGKPIPVRLAGTKARAVRLRGMVGVLQDQWHAAGVWPWLDGQRFIDRPWVLTMEGLAASIGHMSREDVVQRYPPMRVTRVNPATRTITITADGREPLRMVVPASSAAKSRRPAFIPTRRLDGRR